MVVLTLQQIEEDHRLDIASLDLSHNEWKKMLTNAVNEQVAKLKKEKEELEIKVQQLEDSLNRQLTILKENKKATEKVLSKNYFQQIEQMKSEIDKINYVLSEREKYKAEKIKYIDDDYKEELELIEQEYKENKERCINNNGVLINGFDYGALENKVLWEKDFTKH